jgi:hypothetical protein
LENTLSQNNIKIIPNRIRIIPDSFSEASTKISSTFKNDNRTNYLLQCFYRNFYGNKSEKEIIELFFRKLFFSLLNKKINTDIIQQIDLNSITKFFKNDDSEKKLIDDKKGIKTFARYENTSEISTKFINKSKRKRMEITDCPHSERKHYAKVILIKFILTVEHVSQLLLA